MVHGKRVFTRHHSIAGNKVGRDHADAGGVLDSRFSSLSVRDEGLRV